ncbi:hypothetical protein [Estrella lausannensis]|uniref:Conserved putative secreted protein n=1 Tax=Estrella lausannensis TaxID=483423 RepID=A0A0H5E325_9BACT|nr:hypothetical protein [Estrella lausannensis]CRX37585.1 Conserved putative secreted protein [Estrella lausannensis]
MINTIVNKYLLIALLVQSFMGSTGYANAVLDAEKEFERAWDNPHYTQVKLSDIPINETLTAHYETDKPVHFTTTMLWDVEAKKAWDPKTYIPYVVRTGKSWGRVQLDNGDELFVRSSEQREWMDKSAYGEVFEKVYLNHKDKKATFLGAETLEDSSGRTLLVKRKQPLFHVQHSVAGSEDHPLNVWKIVFLTDHKDERLSEEILKLDTPQKLPGYVEIYIERDLNTKIIRK